MALIIDHFHRKSKHNGMPYVINKLCKNFCHRTRKHCKERNQSTMYRSCNRRAGSGVQIMSPLSSVRVQSGKCMFSDVGVDFMRHILVKYNSNILKRCCVFTCMIPCAWHLEVAFDPNTGSFLMALRQFLTLDVHRQRQFTVITPHTLLAQSRSLNEDSGV